MTLAGQSSHLQCQSPCCPQELPHILSPTSRPSVSPQVQLSGASPFMAAGTKQLSREGCRDMVISVTQDSPPLAKQLSGWLQCWRFASSPKCALCPLTPSFLNQPGSVSPLTQGKKSTLSNITKRL